MAGNLIKAAGDCGSGTTAQDLLDTLGEDIFNKLRDHFSGMDVMITSHPSDDHPLVQALGREDAELVCDEFAGILLYIPKAGNSYDARDAFVCRALAEGISRAEVAKALDISMRQLRKYTRRLGLSRKVAQPSGLTIEDVAASIKESGRTVVDFEQEIITRMKYSRAPSAFGATRKLLMLSLTEKVDRKILNTLASTVRYWDRVFGRYVSSELTREQARILSGFSDNEFRHLLGRFRETGTIVPPDQARAALPAVSNAPLTHGPAFGGASLHSARENRASGL